MKKIKNLFSVSLGKAASLALLLSVVVAAAVPVLAQTADVRYAGVFFNSNTKSMNQIYCDWSLVGSGAMQIDASSPDNRSFVYAPSPSGNSSPDPWVSSALIEYDQPYYSTTPWVPKYPNHCLALCANVVCTNKPLGGSTYSIPFPLQNLKFDVVKYYNNKNVENPEETPAIRTIDLYPNTEEAKCGSYSCSGAMAGNPCPQAEYICDQSICSHWSTSSDSEYVNQCAIVSGDPFGNSWKIKSQYSTTACCFPISVGIPGQRLQLDHPEDIWEMTEIAYNQNCEMSAGAKAAAQAAGYTGVQWGEHPGLHLIGGTNAQGQGNGTQNCTWSWSTSSGAWSISGSCPGAAPDYDSKEPTCGKYGQKCILFNNDGTPTNKPISFCAAWDGSYPIAGEFGKTNGQFAFRATVSTDVPGDNIITDKIQFDSTIVYPGMNQIPIQVDVTNIHTVRSTPSLVGNITAVSAQPYTYAYRLSKDADVRIGIFDAATDDNRAYGDPVYWQCDSNAFTAYTPATDPEENAIKQAAASRCCSQPTWYSDSWDDGEGAWVGDCTTGGLGGHNGFDGIFGYFDQPDGSGGTAAAYGCCVGSINQPGLITHFPVTDISTTSIVRTLADWQPRLGEGMKGVENDVQITEFDSWDGRNDDGLLLPAGNYVVSLQAKTQDEWPGIDFSRAVTRQLSLDPLKLTDIVATGLTKQSTAYATITYTPTESSKVYWYVYTPGTTFINGTSTLGEGGISTDSSAVTGTEPTILGDATNGATGNPVYVLTEDRLGRMNFTSKWDGLCGMDGTVPFHVQSNQPYPAEAVDANGAPLTGLCTAGVGDMCTYYMPKCVRTYADNEKMSDGGYCGDANHPYTLATSNVCQETFDYGAPMPDGNYIYALWAEIPYNGCYYNKASTYPDAPIFVANTACDPKQYGGDTKSFTGVKTLKYNVGQIAIERGIVDITIQPVSYSTVGSSPTAYGLDPFIFKYSIARDANVVAKVTNTAGVDVKYLTPVDGITQVAQQMNTLSWDGRDDAGRMVAPGTYMFVVEAKDAMFPAFTNRATAVFPVDMYRLVDVSTTDVYGDSNARATISYMLSKAMNVQINIYNKDIVIPNYNTTPGDYGEASAGNTTTTVGYISVFTPGSMTIQTGPNPGDTLTLTGDFSNHTTVTQFIPGTPNIRRTISIGPNPSYTTVTPSTNWYDTYLYRVTVVEEELDVTAGGTLAWPPRLCDTTTDAAYFTGGYVDPAKLPQCIYVRDTTFTNYPADPTEAASGVVDVRLQPIHTIERTALKPGEGLQLTEEWDALYFYNPSKCAAGSTNLKNCPYEMLPDGQYPFYISARSNEPFDRYYYDPQVDTTLTDYTIAGEPFTQSGSVQVVQQEYLYATDRVVNKLNVTRGPVFFLDGTTVVYPNAPQLFNVSSGPVFIPPYEINFSVSRAAVVEVAIVALQAGVCNPDPTVHQDLKNNIAGDVCKFVSTMTIADTGHFDPTIVRKTYWDGTDNNGYYVRPGIYEVRLTAKNYPDAGLYQTTVKSITLNADLFKVFDLLEADGYSISTRGTDMKISYQLSLPMKIGIQIFKPGTTIYDYQKGTLRNPTTGAEVKDIREVLVKAITGIRPGTTLIEEVWDGTDYANQEVPDGTYPFRFVTAMNSADIDSVTGEIIGEWATTDGQNTDPSKWKVNKVADTYEYQNLHKATIAIGDGRFVCDDWEKTVFFYPNPFKTGKGTLEVTKMPVPGEMSIKYYNLAGDLVREGNYTCVDANNYQVNMGSSLTFNPDNTPDGSTPMTPADLAIHPNVRNAAMRCFWDRTNQHGKKVARGVYFGLVDFKAKMGREHCQKVVKILIP